jgi:Domain of unknown function (DUF4434)
MPHLMTPIQIAVIIAALFLPGILLGDDTHAHPPTLDGGFWQVGPDLIGQFTDDQLAAEVGYMKQLGMEIIVIQYSGPPYWEKGQTDYISYFPNSIYPVHPAFQNRHAFDSIFRAAEQHGVRIYLGGLLIEPPRWEDYDKKLKLWTNLKSLQFRKEAVVYFSQFKSFAGYYIPNEPNFDTMISKGADPEKLRRATFLVSSFLKQANSEMTIIKSIGLYLERFPDNTLGPVSEKKLDLYWRPWVSSLKAVDTWMVIDGVGTNLSNLKHTDMAQGWAREICDEFGKSYWTDLENAHMGTNKDGEYISSSFTISELEASLAVAAKHADTIITFDYIHYMSKQSPKEEARKLHTDYTEYLNKFSTSKETPVTPLLSEASSH